jgi:hypothetical protein
VPFNTRFSAASGYFRDLNVQREIEKETINNSNICDFLGDQTTSICVFSFPRNGKYRNLLSQEDLPAGRNRLIACQIAIFAPPSEINQDCSGPLVAAVVE